MLGSTIGTQDRQEGKMVVRKGGYFYGGFSGCWTTSVPGTVRTTRPTKQRDITVRSLFGKRIMKSYAVRERGILKKTDPPASTSEVSYGGVPKIKIANLIHHPYS